MASLMNLVLLYIMLNTIAELPSTAWPCRLRHVEGQRIPELHFQAEPFLSALRKLQDHRYGQKMRTYQPPSENLFDSLLSDDLSDALSEPSEEEVKLRKIHMEWIDLHANTRSNLLKFESSRFQLPRQATGEQDVKNLVSSICHSIASLCTEPYSQLGQLNDIVRLCQRFELGFDMSEVDWPLLTVEFNSLRGRPMDGIYEVRDNSMPNFSHPLMFMFSSSTFLSVLSSINITRMKLTNY